MMACQEVMEACLVKMETNRDKMWSEVVNGEVLEEEAAVQAFGAVKKWQRGWHVAAGCCGKLKDWTQDNYGSQKKFAAACRGMTN
jgi:hypothetical protein